MDGRVRDALRARQRVRGRDLDDRVVWHQRRRADSIYLGHELADTVVSELRAAPGGDRHTHTRSYPHAELPVMYEPERCLYDHLQRLQELIADAVGEPVAIDQLDAALEKRSTRRR